MASKAIKTLRASNAQILNAVRNDASLTYQQRVPAATQGNIEATVSALWQYRPLMNEFLDSLINRIGDVIYRSKTWTSPLARFKRGMMEYGDTIEDIASGILKAKSYDPNKDYEDVFKRTLADVEAAYHRINRQDYYELTINSEMLRRAFTGEGSLQNFVNGLLDSPYTSDNWDEYKIMLNLFAEYETSQGFYKIQVTDPTTASGFDARRDAAMDLTEKVRSVAAKMRFISTKYNASGIPTWTSPESLVLFCTPEFEAAMDVNVLAWAFNASAADINLSIVEIDEFPEAMGGAVALLADEDIFVCADTLFTFESIYNPKGLYTNYWLHHHGIYSVTPFVNAVLFTTDSPSEAQTSPTITVSGVTLSGDAEAAPGDKIQITASVAGTVEPETEGVSVPQGVVYSVAGDKPLAMATQIDREGWLNIDRFEKSSTLTVTAIETTSTDANKSGTHSVTVKGNESE